MDLSDALAAYGTPEFARVLAAGLEREGHRLPTERGCGAGGRPHVARVASVGEVVATTTRVTVGVTVGFTEAAGPGCGGAAAEYHRLLDCRVEIDRATGRAAVTAVEPDRSEEF